MCLAVPLKIKEIHGQDAVGVREGIERTFRTDLVKDVAIGDYVIVHAGFAIEKLNEEQARESEAAAMELAAAVREIRKDAEQRRNRRLSQ